MLKLELMKMIRQPSYSGKIQKKDELDILYWAINKSPQERLTEAWRLHCVNHNVDAKKLRLNKSVCSAKKRNG